MERKSVVTHIDSYDNNDIQKKQWIKDYTEIHETTIIAEEMVNSVSHNFVFN